MLSLRMAVSSSTSGAHAGSSKKKAGPLVLPQDEVVGGRVATEVDAGRADGNQRGSGRAAYGGLDGEPSAEARADDGGRGECVGEVGDGEREVVDRVGPLRTFAAAEARQLRRNDLEALGEQVEERRPRGRELVVDEEQARAVPVAESGDADVGDVDGDLGWGHEG